MVVEGAVDDLLALPFTNLAADVDGILAEHARRERGGPSENAAPFYRVLYAWRLRHGDFRGAAAVLVERLEGRDGGRRGGEGVGGDVLGEYLLAINALVVAGGEGAWVVVGGEDAGGKGGGGGGGGGRKVLRLEDVRRGYQTELDRRSVLEGGQWGIVGGEEEEEGGEGEGGMDWD